MDCFRPSHHFGRVQSGVLLTSALPQPHPRRRWLREGKAAEPPRYLSTTPCCIQAPNRLSQLVTWLKKPQQWYFFCQVPKETRVVSVPTAPLLLTPLLCFYLHNLLTSFNGEEWKYAVWEGKDALLEMKALAGTTTHRRWSRQAGLQLAKSICVSHVPHCFPPRKHP